MVGLAENEPFGDRRATEAGRGDMALTKTHVRADLRTEPNFCPYEYRECERGAPLRTNAGTA
jgi:hypothetical protein